MEKKLFRRGLGALALLAATALSACTPTGTTPGGSTPQGTIPEEELTGNIIVWWPGGSSAVEKAITDAKDAYEDLHPGVSVDIRFQSTADFYLSYNMALLGNEFPDVAYIDHVYVQRLAYDGSIANLSGFGLDAEEDKFIDSCWTPNLYQGNLYAMPMSANVLTRVYNKALISSVLGREMTDADLPTDWDSYIALGDKIKAYNSANNLTGNDELYLTTVPAGTGAESMGALYYLGMTTREGGAIMSDDYSQMTISSAENLEAATKIQTLGKGGYTPLNFSESKFEQGKVAFIEMGPWKMLDYSRIENGTSIDFEYAATMPHEDGGSIASGLGLYSLILTRKSQNQALAADFIRYLTTSKDMQLAHNTVQYLMPATKEGLADEYYQTPEWEVFVEQLNHVVARPGTAAWPAIEKELAQFVTSLVNGEREPSYVYSLQAALEETLYDYE